MRPFKQRLVLTLWAIWLIASALSCVYFFTEVFSTKTITIVGKLESSPASMVLPELVVQAYTSGKMTSLERRQFERDVRHGMAYIPFNMQIQIPENEAPTPQKFYELVGFSGFFAIILMIFQYLLVGLIDPIRLLKTQPSKQ